MELFLDRKIRFPDIPKVGMAASWSRLSAFFQILDAVLTKAESEGIILDNPTEIRHIVDADAWGREAAAAAAAVVVNQRSC